MSRSTRSSAPPIGVVEWYGVFGGVGAWAIHLVLLAGVVQYTCNASGSRWIIHATTALTVLMTVGAMLISRRMMAAGGDDLANTADARRRFLGLLGLAVGAISLALILLEELLADTLYTRRCG